MPDITIYHNPRCMMSRKTLDLIRKKGIHPRIIEYLKDPPNEAELDRILKALSIEPRDLMRTKEKEYAKLKLADRSLTRRDLIRAMVKHPILIERPIVIKGAIAVLGRPPENIRKIL